MVCWQREKREFELERQQLRAKLEADRQEKIKNGLLKPAAAAKPHVPEAASAPNPAGPAKPKSEREKEAEAAIAAAAGAKRSYDEDLIERDEAVEKLCALSDTKVKPALDMMSKVCAHYKKIAGNLAPGILRP